MFTKIRNSGASRSWTRENGSTRARSLKPAYENISGSKRNESSTKSTVAGVSAIKANRGKFPKVGKIK